MRNKTDLKKSGLLFSKEYYELRFNLVVDKIEIYIFNTPNFIRLFGYLVFEITGYLNKYVSSSESKLMKLTIPSIKFKIIDSHSLIKFT